MKRKGTEKLWWDYINRVHGECRSIINEDCSKRAHKHLKLNWQSTIDCYEASFSSQTNREKESVKNYILDNEIALWLELGAQIYPSIAINKKTYRGQIEPLAVFNAICAGFKEPPH